jgi:hypothetical protein
MSATTLLKVLLLGGGCMGLAFAGYSIQTYSAKKREEQFKVGFSNDLRFITINKYII